MKIKAFSWFGIENQFHLEKHFRRVRDRSKFDDVATEYFNDIAKARNAFANSFQLRCDVWSIQGVFVNASFSVVELEIWRKNKGILGLQLFERIADIVLKEHRYLFDGDFREKILFPK